MARTSASIQSINTTPTNGDHNSNVSSSYFQKTVCLHDWWLIMAENDFQGKRLAVAGLTSREQQAVRVFSSAPILKRYDVFTLETVDGICVLIKGFINKVRTIENGFSSEVFNHFVFGFPPSWEEYAEKCLEGGFNNEDVSRSTLGSEKLSTDSGSVDDFSEGTPNRNKKAISEERHDNSDKIDLSSEDSGHSFSTKGQHKFQDGACNESSVENPKICSSQIMSKIIISGASKGSDLQNEVHLGSTASPVNSDVHDVQNDAIDPPLSLHSDRNTVNSSEVDIAVQQKYLDRCVTRSCKSKGITKSERKGKKRTGGESEREGSESFIILNDNVDLDDASIESPLPKSSDVYKARKCKFTKAVPLETSGMNLKSSGERSESPKRNDKDEEKAMLRNGSANANFSTISLSLSPEAVITCADENSFIVSGSTSSTIGLRETEKETLPTGPVVENTQILVVSKNFLDDTMKCPKPKLSSEDNISAPPNMDMNVNATSTTTNTKRSRNSRFKKLRCPEGTYPKRKRQARYLKYKNRNFSPALKAREDLDIEKLNSISAVRAARFVGRNDILEEISPSEGRMSKRLLSNSKSKLKDDQTTVNLLENETNKLNSVSTGNSDQLKNAAVNGESESGGRSIFIPSGVELQQAMDVETVRNLHVECVKDGFHQNYMFSSTNTDAKQEQMCGKITSQAGKQSKNTNKAPRSSIGLSDANQKDDLQIPVSKKETNAKKASKSRKKTKRKLTYESPVSQGGTEETSFISPESSFKRSRSGRLLLPTLEFWRNQMPIYDKDRQITGIQEGLRGGGSRSEHRR